jgi:hypothetical protein
MFIINIFPVGVSVRFNVETLIDYMLATGDFADPETRVQFADAQLTDIDRTAQKYGLRKSSVFESKYRPGAFADLKFRRDALCGLERCAGEVVTDMLNIIETCDPEEAQMRLAMRGLPELFVLCYCLKLFTFCVAQKSPYLPIT